MNQIQMQLTRYLYVKKEVEIALLLSILDKKEDAVFWAYELYYSGFKKELSQFLFQIYYDFFACLNPKFEKYLLIKLKNNLSDCETNPEIISSIIHNFIYRPYTIDVFLLKQIGVKEEFIIKNNTMTFLKDIMNNSKNNSKLVKLFENIITYFHKKGVINDIQLKNAVKDFEKIKKNRIIDLYSAVLSRYLYFISIEKGIKMGKNVIIMIEPEEVIVYETMEHELPARKILKTACLCKIPDQKYMTLFSFEHRNPLFKDRMYYKWHYWASYSPLWRERIEKYNGIIDHRNEEIIFPNDDIFEDYYNHFNLEPDEQSKETQNRFMGELLSDLHVRDFYNQYNKNSILNIDNSFMNIIEKFNY